MKLVRSFVALTVTALLFSLFSVAHAEPAKIGVALPLSGPIARMGIAVKQGIELFQALEPEKAARLQFLFEDHKYDGKETVTILTKFAKVDHASMAVVWGNTPAGAAAPLAQNLGIDTVMISHDPHSEKFSHVIELGPSATACIGVIADRVKSVGPTTFGTIGIDIGNVIWFLDTIDKDVGATLFREIVATDAANFQPQLLRGKSKGMGTYLLALMPDQALNLLQQARQLKLTFSVIGIDAFADSGFLAQAKELMPDLSFVYGAGEPWFVKEYRKKYGDTSFITEASSGYVFAQLAAATLPASKAPHAMSFHDRVKAMSLDGLAYKDARWSAKGVRIAAPCELISAQEYLKF